MGVCMEFALFVHASLVCRLPEYISFLPSFALLRSKYRLLKLFCSILLYTQSLQGSHDCTKAFP